MKRQHVRWGHIVPKMSAAQKSNTVDECHDSDTPPGWSYNPSSWSERLWIVCVAGIGLAVSAYLTLYQIGVVKQVWEPWFGSGSRTVLNSFLSHVLPIPT